MFEQQGGDAFAPVEMVDHERHIGVVTRTPPLITRPRCELAVYLEHQCHAVHPIDVGEVPQFIGAERALGGEEASVLALARLPLVECQQCGGVTRFDVSQECRLAIAQHDGRAGELGRTGARGLLHRGKHCRLAVSDGRRSGSSAS